MYATLIVLFKLPNLTLSFCEKDIRFIVAEAFMELEPRVFSLLVAQQWQKVFFFLMVIGLWHDFTSWE